MRSRVITPRSKNPLLVATLGNDPLGDLRGYREIPSGEGHYVSRSNLVETLSEKDLSAQSQPARRPQTFQFNGDRSSPCRTSDVFLPSLHSSNFHTYTWAATTNF